MRLRRAAWIAFGTSAAIVLSIACMDPVLSSDPAFGFVITTSTVALFLGSIAGAYLLFSYLDRWASKA